MNTPSYHDLFITTSDIPRTSISNLPFNYKVICTRSAGWELWIGESLAASEYAKDNWLVLDVLGNVIVDGRDNMEEVA
ncbi:hypothetical protein NKW54_08660 [Acetobacter cerevisiae]|uniref:Uncharacterized protein n=1 Tax=Acetobacter cerevisiae TaxID=178900 RepID=A0ABT1EVQ3_9PROT|nr:hypothetical protein [Acetobacter cerevisiae]MCP1246010.1 hypothetical protein [Acetobacter cerevisiae]MCP1255728.1 hypothetical protein [Acetobacter cerevisiae]